MTTKEARIEALELAAGPKETEAEAEARALQEMPFEELEQQVREILAKHDPPAADDKSEYAVAEREVRSHLARRDAERMSS